MAASDVRFLSAPRVQAQVGARSLLPTSRHAIVIIYTVGSTAWDYATGALTLHAIS
jgi:hypothetical protein